MGEVTGVRFETAAAGAEGGDMVEQKILSFEALRELCGDLRAGGKTIAHCHGVFDPAAIDDLKRLGEAKANADVLVVTVPEACAGGELRPHGGPNPRDRARRLTAVSSVDHVATIPWPAAARALSSLRPHLFYLGHAGPNDGGSDRAAIVERSAMDGLSPAPVSLPPTCHSSAAPPQPGSPVEESSATSDYLTSLRRQFRAADVLAEIDRLKSVSVLVVGEAIVDEYHYCLPDAMSNKSATLSVRFEAEERFAGGVVAVANHLAELCRHVRVVAGMGAEGPRSDVLTQNLADGVSLIPVVRPDGPTVRKRRFLHGALNQKLFEVTFLNDRPIPRRTQIELQGVLEAEAPQADVVIVLDFGHGFLADEMTTHLRRQAKFLAVNAQINSSNRGFNSVRKYAGADHISIDEYEIRLPFGDRYGPLDGLVRALEKETGCRRINVTLGHRGSRYYDGQGFHQAPVLVRGVVDALGAGDALLAATSLMAYSGAPSPMVPFVGNCMGGLMAQIVGHRHPVRAADLRRLVQALL